MKRPKRKRKQKQPWTPFERCEHKTRSEIRDMIVREAAGTQWEGHDPEPIVNQLLAATTWKNNQYTVAVNPVDDTPEMPCKMVHLSIKRNDRNPIENWSHLQRIKNEIVGRENEAVELYPAESRLVNTANQYHLWVLAEPGIRFPFGFTTRAVDTQRTNTNSKQRLEPT